MNASRINAGSLATLLAAGVLILLLAVSQGFTFVTAIAGLVLLFIIFAYDQEGVRSIFQSLAFGGTAGFALMVACGILFQLSINRAGDVTAKARQDFLNPRLAITWAFATVFFWAIDRARMGGRVASEAPERFSTVRRTLAPDAPQVVQAPHSQPAVFAPETAASAERVAPPPSQAVPKPAAAAVTTAAPPPVQQAPRGKETMIYVTLLGEGINLLRSVRAEHLGRDYYRIVEEVPEGENWQFATGQVVRCQKRNLSSGKAMVAFEEAPRAQ